jgi:GNAT superfamily N-acetyltransferase
MRIVEYQDRHATAFRDLNLVWIEEFFEVEAKDREQLDHPRESILAPGGMIFLAEQEGEVIGTCALVRESEHEFELVKMAVSHRAQGKGVGRRLLEVAAAWARRQGAVRLTLLSHSKLQAALHLYQSFGFRPRSFNACETGYARCDVAMELPLAQEGEAGKPGL